MNKKISISFTLLIILGLLAIFFFTLLRHQERVKEKKALAYGQGKELYQEGKYSDAVNQLEEVIRRYPKSQEAHDAYFLIALSFSQRGDYQEARDNLLKLLEDFPESNYIDRVYYQLGWIEEQKGQPGEALSFYQKIITHYAGGPIIDEAILGQGRVWVKQKEWELAREAFGKVRDDFPKSNSFLLAREELGNLNIKLIFSPVIIDTEDSMAYQVKTGDSLYSISRKFNTTISLLTKSNDLKSSLLRPGKTLKVTPGNYLVKIDKSERSLSLYLNNRLIKVYTVGIGIEDYYTPAGEFKIVNKEKDPAWRGIPSDDPKNILGTRWMGISSPGYGIHGTTEPETVGKKSSQGCIRMLNKDVEEIYDLITIETPVIIVE